MQWLKVNTRLIIHFNRYSENLDINIIIYSSLTLIIFFQEFHAGSSELRALVREFRSHALELLDMLDSSLPIVAKLKVCFRNYFFQMIN